MSFDPNKPENGSPLSSAVMRNQLNGLHTEITAIPKGDPGEKGDPGDPGPQGPPFAQAVVDGVNTTPPGSSAGVGVSFDGSLVHFTFDIPRGDKGDQGDPGEVAQTTLDGAIAGTANNVNNVGTFGDTHGDPVVQGLIDKVNELINGLHR